MAKRKLSTQQHRRVAAKRLTREPDLTGPLQSGLVITNFGKRVLVEADDGQEYSCSIRQHLGKLAAGDKVIWQQDLEPLSGIVSQVKERQNLLSRPGFRGEIRMVAANINTIAIVVPVLPEISADMIDRYLIAAEQLQIPSFIILNKIDLIGEGNHCQRLDALMQPYSSLELDIVEVSNKKRSGMNGLIAALDDHTSVFVGPSGAGKSSLIKSLIPDQEIRIGELSAATGLGSHTTSNSILYHLPDGGNIIDSPGVRVFSPSPCDLATLEKYFQDFAPYLGQCRFNNCTHRHEPGCAILGAVEAECVSKQRVDSFHRLLDEFAEQEYC